MGGWEWRDVHLLVEGLGSASALSSLDVSKLSAITACRQRNVLVCGDGAMVLFTVCVCVCVCVCYGGDPCSLFCNQK